MRHGRRACVAGAHEVAEFRSFGFSSECLGQHSGDAQAANLGDGRGYGELYPVLACGLVPDLCPLAVNESAVIRWDYGDPALGTCTETIQGGNHFRYWVQDGKSADRCATLSTEIV